MDEEVNAYIRYLSNLKEISRPQMPTFDISAYSDSEYRLAIDKSMKDFEGVDDYSVTLHYLKGE